MDLIFPVPWASNGDKEEIPQYADANGKVSFQTGFGVDYEKSLTLTSESKNIERAKLNYILNRLCVAVNTLSQQDGLPVGMPIPWPSWTLPEGNFTYYDGRGFTIATNPKLAALFPGGYLPDLRGLVIRGVDSTRGLDPNRELLSYQADAMQQITGRIVIDGNAYVAEGAFWFTGDAGRQGASNRGTSKYCNFDSARQTRVASETRMKNMAFLYITKAG